MSPIWPIKYLSNGSDCIFSLKLSWSNQKPTFWYQKTEYYNTLWNYEAFWKCDCFQKRVKSPRFVLFTKTAMLFISILKENYLLHIYEWGTIQIAFGYILRCKNLEQSSLNIILIIRDQSGSEIYGQTVYRKRYREKVSLKRMLHSHDLNVFF